MTNDDEQLELAEHPETSQTAPYAQPPVRRPATNRKRDDANERLADSTRRYHEAWRIGMCEGAALYRKRLMAYLSIEFENDFSSEDRIMILGAIGEVDARMRQQFPEEYERQLQIRTKESNHE